MSVYQAEIDALEVTRGGPCIGIIVEDNVPSLHDVPERLSVRIDLIRAAGAGVLWVII